MILPDNRRRFDVARARIYEIAHLDADEARSWPSASAHRQCTRCSVGFNEFGKRWSTSRKLGQRVECGCECCGHCSRRFSGRSRRFSGRSRQRGSFGGDDGGDDDDEWQHDAGNAAERRRLASRLAGPAAAFCRHSDRRICILIFEFAASLIFSIAAARLVSAAHTQRRRKSLADRPSAAAADNQRRHSDNRRRRFVAIATLFAASKRPDALDVRLVSWRHSSSANSL